MTLYGYLVLAGIYVGFMAAHTFGLVGWEVFGAVALIISILFGAAEAGR